MKQGKEVIVFHKPGQIVLSRKHLQLIKAAATELSKRRMNGILVEKHAQQAVVTDGHCLFTLPIDMPEEIWDSIPCDLFIPGDIIRSVLRTWPLKKELPVCTLTVINKKKLNCELKIECLSGLKLVFPFTSVNEFVDWRKVLKDPEKPLKWILSALVLKSLLDSTKGKNVHFKFEIPDSFSPSKVTVTDAGTDYKCTGYVMPCVR